MCVCVCVREREREISVWCVVVGAQAKLLSRVALVLEANS